MKRGIDYGVVAMRGVVLPDAEAPVVIVATDDADVVLFKMGGISVEVSAAVVSKSELLSDLGATSARCEDVIVPIHARAMQQWLLYSTRRSRGIVAYAADVGDVKLLLQVLCSIRPQPGLRSCVVSVRVFCTHVARMGRSDW